MVCENCGEEADFEVMPCCGGLVCWDFCLCEQPDKCPLCGIPIRVTMNSEESYVEVVDLSETNTINIESEDVILYVPISQEKKGLRRAHQELISMLVGTGWVHGGNIKLKDFSGNEAEFAVVKGSLKE